MGRKWSIWAEKSDEESAAGAAQENQEASAGTAYADTLPEIR